MVNHNTKKEASSNISKREIMIRTIIENRLQMQSVQRYLADYNVPGRDIYYFQSKDFVENHFKTWTSFRKKNFLVKLVGSSHWKEFNDMLERK